jgi:type 1 glutamine amidotransferase
MLGNILSKVPALDVQISHADGAWEQGPEKLRAADGAFLFLSQGAKWIHEEPRRLEAFAQLAARGGGLSTLHWGMGTKEPQYIDGFVKLFGGCHGGPDRKFAVLDANVSFPDPQHEIANSLRPFRVHEEFYYRLKFLPATPALKPIVTAEIEGRPEAVAWAWERGDGGRSFGFSGGHFHRNWELPEYRKLVAQGILWTMKVPIPKEGLDVNVTADDLKLP